MRCSEFVLWTLFSCTTLATYNPVLFIGDEIPTHSPQTPEQEALGKAQGRVVGALELLQPTLDPNLTDYIPISTPLSGNYTFAASDVLAVLSKLWIHAFMQIYPNITMTIPPPYAGSLGADELISGLIQGVFVSRELRPSDISIFSDHFGYPPTSVPISGGSYRQFGFLDAMAFVVNKENPIESLSFDQLDSILSTTHARGGGNLTKWGDVGVSGALAEEDIKIYGIQPWNGFEEFIRQRVLSYGGVRGEWRSGNSSDKAYDPLVTWDTTVFNLSRHVSEDAAGLAYTGLAYIDSPVKVIALSNHTSAADLVNISSPYIIAPIYENIATATWPLSRVTYFNTNTDITKGMDPVLRELQRFVLSRQGQKILLDQAIFLPFRAKQQKISLQMLE